MHYEPNEPWYALGHDGLSIGEMHMNSRDLFRLLPRRWFSLTHGASLVGKWLQIGQPAHAERKKLYSQHCNA
jgi:hypothetical protein